VVGKTTSCDWMREGKKADEDVGLNAVFVLMPDRTKVELIFLDAKSGLGVGELNIGLPELLIGPVVDVRAQKVGALGQRGPVVE
jgi:hypothetical protein